VSFDCADLCLTDTRLAISAVTTNNVFEKAIIQNHKTDFFAVGESRLLQLLFQSLTLSCFHPTLNPDPKIYLQVKKERIVGRLTEFFSPTHPDFKTPSRPEKTTHMHTIQVPPNHVLSAMLLLISVS